MKNCCRLFSLVVLWLTISLSTSWAQNEVTYGFVQEPGCPAVITAIAIPNYSSTNVTISTAVFSFLLPEGTVTNPSVAPVPATGSFNNISGIWAAQLVTPTVYGNVGFNPADLMGNDVYQVVLQNSPEFNAGNPVVAGTPIELFSFELPSDCVGGDIQVLVNDSPIQVAILNNLGANFNNQMSMSINDAPTSDIYAGNDPNSSTLTCPLLPTFMAIDDFAATCEDQTVNVNILSNEEGLVCIDNMSPITITSSASNGTVSIDDNGTPNDPTDDILIYTPDPGFSGTDQVNYQICDINGNCSTATVTVTVNQNPTVNPDDETVQTGGTVNIAGNPTPGNGTIVTHSWTITNPGTTGITAANLSNEDTPTLTVDATGLSVGTVELTYTVTDDNGCSGTGTSTLTINDVPVANDDIATTDENTLVNIDVLANDDFGTDGPGTGPITVLAGPTNGTAVVNDGGTPNDPTDDTIDYTPNNGFDGTDSFTYQICDSDGDCDDAVVTVTVRNAQIGIAKAASTPVDNGDGSFTTTITLNIENFGDVALGDIQVSDDLSAFGTYVTLANLDMEGEYTVSNLMFTSNTANPLSVDAGFTGAGADTLLLDVTAGGTLAVGEVATLSFDLRFNPAQDSYTNTAIATGDVPANDDPVGSPDDDPEDTTDDSTDGPNPDPNNDDIPEEEIPTPIDPDDAPIAVDDMASTDPGVLVNVDVLVNDDFGSDGPSVGSITVVTAPANGTATVDNNGTPNDPTDDSIDYTPGPGFSGTDVFTYQICDSDGDCDNAVVTIEVANPQIGIAKAASTPVNNNDGTFTTTITLRVENLGSVALGDIQVTDDLSAFGSFVSLANLDMEGEYTVSNLAITSNSANPLFVNAGFNGAGVTELLNVPAGGTLNPGEVVVLSFNLRFNPAQDSYLNTAIATGDLPANDDPTGNPDDDPDDTTDDSTDGTDPDPDGNGDPEEMIPTPIDPDDAPDAVNDMASTDQNTPINIDPLVNDDFGSDGPSMGTITLISGPINGTGVVNDGGTPNDPTDDTVDYTPNPGFSGSDIITYQICDSDGDCDVASINITIRDAQIGIAKAASTPVVNGDGSFTTTITLTVENFGQVELGDIQVTDDLSAFGSFVSLANLDMAGEYTVSNLAFGSNSANSLSVNSGFNGASDTELLNVSAGGTLAVGEVVTLSFDLRFIAGQDTYLNTAVASGDVPLNDDPTGSPDDDPDDTTDDSTDGTNPDPNNNDNPDEDTPTPIDPNDVPDAVNDVASTDQATPINIDPLINDSFGSDGPGTGTITIISGPINGTGVVDNGGTPNDPTDDTIDYTPGPGFSGSDIITYQICDSDGDCDVASINITVRDALIGIAKSAGTPVVNGDGSFTTTITLTVENLGQVELGDVQVTDDLSAFGSFVTLANLDMAGEYTVSGLTFVTNSANSMSVNTGFNGAGDTEMLNVAAGGTLAVGEVVTLSFDLRFIAAQDTYLNTAVASGDVPANDDPVGSQDDDPDDTTDDSTDGTDPDPNNNGDPEEDTPTPIDPNDIPVAIDDVATTNQNTTVAIDVLVNDDFGSDGPSTGAIAVVASPVNGFVTLINNGTPNDPSDDSFEYTPNPGYTGTDIFNYEICDSDGDCDVATVTITVLEAQIGIAKAASTPVAIGGGLFTTTITLTVENFSQVVLGDIQVTDDLSAFGSFVTLANLDMEGEYTVSNLAITSNSADPLFVNSGFNGASDIELLDVSAGGTLGIGEVVLMSFDLTFNPAQDSYINVAIATGDVPTNDNPTGTEDDDPADTTDESTDGTNPDPNNDDDPEEMVPTPIDPDDVPDAVNDAVSTPQNTPLNIDPLVNDDFGSDGPGVGTISILAGPINGTGVVDNGGTPNDQSDDTIDYTPNPGYSGNDIITYQICDSDGDCDIASINISVLNAEIGIAKLASPPVLNGDGSFTTTFTMNVENLGNVALGDIQVTDDLTAFGSFVTAANLDMIGEYTVSSLTITSNSANPLSVNSGFNGAFDINMLNVAAGGTLGIGETVTISFNLTFFPAQDTYLNTAVASGDVPVNDDPVGSPDDDPDDTTDDSTNGTNPDPNNDGDPEEDVPTPIDPNDVPDAMNDVASTDQSTPINIDPLVNDDFGSDGPSTGAITIISGPIDGTGVVNNGGTPNDPTDDTFDYTPDPGFSGNDIITYQICDSDGDCDIASVNITVRDAQIGIAKASSTPVSNGDGTYTTTITMTVENLGQIDLGDIQVTDDLSGFGTFVSLANLDMDGEYTVSNLMMVSNSANPLSVNTGFNGSSDTELLNVAAGGTLAVGEVVTLSFDLRLDPAQDTYTNIATATGDVPFNDDPTGSPDDDPEDTTDDSTDGTDPDPNGNGNPEENTPTPIDPDDVPDAVNDMVSTDQNTPINIDPLVNDDFGADGPSVGTITIISGPIDGTGVVNNGGTPNDPTDDTFDYTPNPNFSGNDIITYQICDSDGDCDIASVNIMVRNAQIGIAKAASTPVDNGDGTFTTTITLNVENLGQVDLGDIQVTDDLSGFGTFVTLANLDTEGEYTVSNLMITANSANPLSANSGFNGSTDEELLNVAAGGTLAVGEVVTLSFDLTLFPAQDSYINVAVASGDVPVNDDPTGSPDDDPDDTTDDSTDGTDPDPNNNGTPEEDDPTPIDPDDMPVANDDVASTNQNIPVNIDPLPNDDFGSDGPSLGPIAIVTQPGNGTAVVDNGGTPTDPTDDTINYTPNNNFVGNDDIIYQICDSDGDCDNAVITVTVNPTAVKLSARMRLQGALYSSLDGLMRDDLRAQALLPATEPYTALANFTHVNNISNETVGSTVTVFGANGANSIVDWVFVELRSALDPSEVVATRSALLQRDGDVVDVDGISPLCFEQTLPGSFYIAVRHRNHIGTMTANPIPLTAAATIVDFRNTNLDLFENIAALDGFEQVTVNGQYALWAGNTNANTNIIFAGQNNDKDPIFDEINLAPGNIFDLQTYIRTGYNLGDVDMNGATIFAGQNNDVDYIFNNIDGFPLNALKLQTFIIPEQLAGN
jgi:hypothetical protein